MLGFDPASEDDEEASGKEEKPLLITKALLSELGYDFRSESDFGVCLVCVFQCLNLMRLDVSCGFVNYCYLSRNKHVICMSPAGIEPTFKV